MISLQGFKTVTEIKVRANTEALFGPADATATRSFARAKSALKTAYVRCFKSDVSSRKVHQAGMCKRVHTAMQL